MNKLVNGLQKSLYYSPPYGSSYDYPIWATLENIKEGIPPKPSEEFHLDKVDNLYGAIGYCDLLIEHYGDTEHAPVFRKLKRELLMKECAYNLPIVTIFFILVCVFFYLIS